MRVRIPHPHLPHLTLTQVRLLRLFSLLAVFSLLVLYAVFRSDRFQGLLRRTAERRLSAQLGRRVSIGGFDLALLPPSFVVRNVAIANDRRGLPGPCFSAEEIALQGVPRLSSDRLDLPRVRVLAPRVVLEVFEDGSTNLSSLFKPKTSDAGDSGFDVRLGEAVLQRGTFRFREWKARLDTVLEAAALTARSRFLSSTTHASFAARNVRFKLDDNDEIAFAIGVDAVLQPGRVHLPSIRVRSEPLVVDASGGIEDLRRPDLVLATSARFTGETLRRYFGVGVPLEGVVGSSGTVRVLATGGFRIRGQFEIPNARFGPFPMTGSGFVRVDPKGLVVHVARGTYAGGALEALVRLDRLDRPPLPIRIVAKARGCDFEQFFADLGLPGTGLMARSDLDTTLTFGRGGIEHADGVGALRLAAVEGRASAVPGRHALPTSGGGALLVRDGQIQFDRTLFATKGGVRTLLSGTLAFGSWRPDFRFDLAASDLAEAERLASNWYPAIQKEPLRPALELGGSGRLEATLTRAFSDPRIEGTMTAQGFVLRRVPFGETSASFVVDRNVLSLEEFDAFADGRAGGAGPRPRHLSFTGDLAWGKGRGGEYDLTGVVLEVERWPVERILAFLRLDLPLAGLVTGRLPLEGRTPRVTGSVPLVFEAGAAWGQRFDGATGRLTFEKDGLRLDGAAFSLGSGRASGSGTFGYDRDDYAFELGVSGVPMERLDALADALPDLTAVATGRLSGRGTLDAPGLSADVLLVDARWRDRPLAKEGRPACLKATVDGERLDATLDVPETATLAVRSLDDAPRSYRATLDVTDASPYALLLSQPPAAAFRGALKAEMRLAFDAAGRELRSASGRVPYANLELYGKPLRLAREATFHLEGSDVVLDSVALSGSDASAPGAAAPFELRLAGRIGLEEPNAVALSATGAFDASYARVAFPDVRAQGPVAVSLDVGGTLESPLFQGRAVLDGVDFATEGGGSRLEAIGGTLTFTPRRITTSSLSLRFGGGTIGLAGVVQLAGWKPEAVRLNARLDGVKHEPFPGFRATASGDLTLLGDSEVRTIRGEIVLDRGLYDADINLGLGTFLGGLAGGGRPTTAATAFDAAALDVRIVAPTGSMVVRNNVARLTASGELSAQGTFARPLLFGQIEAEEGGRLTLRNVRYELVTGKVLFSNPYKIDPFFELDARTQVKDYQLSIGLTGTFKHLVPRLASDPQLSEAQIVSLLASGELPGTSAVGVPTGAAPVSTDESVYKAARDLIAGAVTDAAASRAAQLFRLDRLQFDPVFVGSSFDAPRFTIGKQISKDLSVTYSYKASTNQEQVVVVEYQLSNKAFLQFVKDERGVYSLDLKIRQRIR